MAPYLYWIDRYTDALQHFIASNLVLAPLLLLCIEEAGVPLPVPGDIIIAYTGYKLSMGHGPGLWMAFVVAQIAVITGSGVLFFLSRRWGQRVIDMLARFVFLKEKHIRQAEQLFAKYGILAIIVGRHIPGLRIPVTIFAAISGVRYLTFAISTFISTSIWILFCLSIGRSLGANFHLELQHYVGGVFVLVLGAGAVVVALHLIGRYRSSRKLSRSDS